MKIEFSYHAFLVAAYGDTGFSTASFSERTSLVLQPYTLEDDAYTKFLIE